MALKSEKYFRAGIFFCLSFFILAAVTAVNRIPASARDFSAFFIPDSPQTDTPKVNLPFPINDNSVSPDQNQGGGSFGLNNPSNIQTNVEYDPETGNYNFSQTIGDSLDYRNPSYMTLDEYKHYDMQKSLKKYWNEKSDADNVNKQKGFRPTLNIESEVFDRIFGGNTIDIRPQGTAELIFGINVARTDNPAIPEKQRRITTFDFNEKIQLNVQGSIGDKMKINTSYNTQAMFDFENVMKLGYTGHEDEILQSIEAGNVSLPLKGSLITGSQSLFGVKTGLKFGKLNVTTVVSQQRGKKSEITTQGGAQVSTFEVKGDNYEANRHFFLGHFFRDSYEHAVSKPPILQSGVMVTKIEVWITNNNFATENTRNIIGFQDLGEGDTSHFFNTFFVSDMEPGVVAHNGANDLYDRMSNDPVVRAFTNATSALNAYNLEARNDYQRIELARRLTETEYTLNPQLGYISLNQELNPNQVLAVAYQYTYNGKTYQVGEFSTDGVTGQNALYLKMLKSSQINLVAPMWDLMMKNVYSINAYQVNKENFQLDIWYLDGGTGVQINYLPEGSVKNQSLIQLLGFDKLNVNNQPIRDGVFDFLDNPLITIAPKNGRIYFPLLEPFGSGLRKQFQAGEESIADKFAFDSLYTNTKTNGQVRFPEKNRFYIKGKYQSSSSSEISLNALNIPQGSVVVTAGGVQLTENVDYTVDYTLGRVKIINQGVLESGTPIKVSLESNSLFNIQTKTLFASRFDYEVNKDLALGATVMNLTERPITQKIRIGDEPMSNTMLGLDGTYKTEAPFLTTLIDKLPLIDTKEKSTITASGEFASLIPGHSKAIGKEGTSYIDDFEGSQSSIDIRSFTTWRLASTPQGQPDLFPEAAVDNNLAYGFNRANFNWHVTDPLFFRNNNLTPGHIKSDAHIQSNHLLREVFETEVFPNRDFQQGQPTNIPMFDLAFFPSERGQYNYDVDGYDKNGTKYGYGLNADGTLKNPEKRWGGIMRRMETNDFDAANIAFIQFWLMDPFVRDENGNSTDYTELFGTNPPADGYLYFNIGNVSEDILRDGQKIFENGLPTTEAEASNLSGSNFSEWGRVIPSNIQQIVNAFDTDPTSRQFQDVGLDGLRDKEESTFFKTPYLDKINQKLGANSVAYQNAVADPSGDNYNYYRDDRYDQQQLNVLQRYKKYNGMDGNSPTSEQSATLNADGFPTTASTLPDAEDINRDNTLDDAESYFQYKVKISPNTISPDNVGNNYITDVYEAEANTREGIRRIKWYQFKIPIHEFEKAVGGIQDFHSIRFVRMYMRGFSAPIVLRFARLELIRGEWRKYLGSSEDPGEQIGTEDNTSFNISAVNIEENAKKLPVNYVLPPRIQRQINLGTTNLQRLNEQAISLSVCNLKDGTFRSAYRNFDLDVRSYKKIQLFVHANAVSADEPLKDGDVRAFIRLGTDMDQNYYEYEVPLKVTPAGFYNQNVEADQFIVWPEENDIEIEFSKLQTAKVKRDRDLLAGLPEVSLQSRYELTDGGNKIYIVGNPNLSTLRTIMVGVRNPKKTFGDNNDDGMPKCAEIWFNELRLSDFDQRIGWAAIGRVTTKLADVGTLQLAGSMSTPGFGSIEKKVSERQRETIQQVDASFTTELGRFLPENARIKIPTYVGFSQNVVKPQFAPLSPDIEMNDYLDAWPDKENQDSVKNSVKTLTVRRSMNFTNVHKERNPEKQKQHFYDVENLSATYSYTETFYRDINTSHNTTKVYKAGLSYNFNPNPKNYTPFNNVPVIKTSKYLALIKDFNFYLLPKQVAFRTDFNRNYNERVTRNNNPGIIADLPPFYNKSFTWARAYDYKQDITKNLKFDFTANNSALITEPEGRVDKRLYEEEYKDWRDSVITSMGDGGVTTNYQHNANVNYNIPLQKFPLTDWINANARYSATYNWQRAPFAADTLGHTVQNSNNKQLNGTFNMNTLYNKSNYLKKVNQKFQKKQRDKDKSKKEKEAEKKKAEEEKKQQIKTETKPPKSNKKLTKKEKKKLEKEKKAKEDSIRKANDNNIYVFDYIFKSIMGFKNVNATWQQTNGLLMPGYQPKTLAVGMDEKFTAPGWGFIFGQNNNFGSDREEFAPYAASNGWLVQQANLSTQNTKTFSENLNLRASLEPVNDMRVELTANGTTSLNTSQFYLWNDSAQKHISTSFQQSGSYSISFITIKTAFMGGKKDGSSPAYDKFLENRALISQRLAINRSENAVSTYVNNGHPNDIGYSAGYGSTSQEVLIPAFLSAYSGNSPNEAKLNPLKNLPKPNWKVTYTGLNKIAFVKKYFKTFSINHSYRSTVNLSSFTSNILFVENDIYNDGFPTLVDLNKNFIPQYQINVVNITESFSPLVNFDMTWQNNIQTRFEFKKDRNISMNISNVQITEVLGQEFVIGAGYKIPKLKLPWKMPGGKDISSDLNIRSDISIRNNKTVIRKVVEGTSQPTAGQRIITVKTTADYALSQRLNLRLFYDYVITKPVTSQTFVTANTNAGISIRFTLAS